MSLLNQIGLGAGLAVAVGLRPFLPALLAGAFASGAVLDVSFAHGQLTYLQRGWFLALLGGLFVVSWAVQLAIGNDKLQRGAGGWVLAAASVVLAALLYGEELCDHGNRLWPGLVAGAVLAVLTVLATRGLLGRVLDRLTDRFAREALSAYLDATALLLAALTMLLKPLGFVAVLAVLYLLFASRGRGERKYAGLRILR